MSRKRFQKRKDSIKEKFTGKNSKKQDFDIYSLKNIFKPALPRTDGQENFYDSILNNDITVCDGPPGCGKTLISLSTAIKLRLEDPNIRKIVIVRPTTLAGDDNDIGFLPGDINEKLSPFTAPLIKDSLPLLLPNKGNDAEMYSYFLENVLFTLNVEVVPLIFMRGRTFLNSFIILDEAQNCTKADLKLFLTRIGHGSRIVIEGDSSQSDIDNGYLLQLQDKLSGVDSVGIVRMAPSDILRHKLISSLLRKLA